MKHTKQSLPPAVNNISYLLLCQAIDYCRQLSFYTLKSVSVITSLQFSYSILTFTYTIWSSNTDDLASLSKI